MSSQQTTQEPHKKEAVQLSDRGWGLMRAMGYQEGHGLGVRSQGTLKPVAVSKQKGRTGLGFAVPALVKEAHSITAPKNSLDEELAWSGKTDHLLTSGDRVWHWRRSGQPEGCQKQLQSYFLSPDEDSACGAPVKEMATQTDFCSEHILHELLAYKNQLDDIADVVIRASRDRANPYELIKKGIFMNRAAMKMANLDYILGGLVSNAVPRDSILHFADVCAGPGGFTEYLLWRRCNSSPLSTDSEDSTPELDGECDRRQSLTGADKPVLNAKAFGFTLTGSCDFRKGDFLAGPSEAFLAHYGPAKDGDITKLCNLASFAALIYRATDGNGVHALIADGGFDVSGSDNLQEVLSKQIYLCQCLCALMVLRPGGHFVTKLFDLFTEFSVGLIFLMSHVFEEVFIIKPVTSRPANSERYMVCKSLISPLNRMAGCPSQHKVSCSSGGGPPAKRMRVSASHRLPAEAQAILDRDKTAGVLRTDEAGCLGHLIEHLVSVNEALRQQHSSSSLSDNRDVLRICHPDILHDDVSFIEFIVKMNEELAQRQCVALSKLLAFAADAGLSDDSQEEVRKRYLLQWQVGMQERKPIPWPLISAHRSAILRGLLGSDEPWTRPKSLRRDLVPHFRVQTLSSRHMGNIYQLVDRHLVLLCGTPITTDLIPAGPVMIYSGGVNNAGMFCSVDGDQWSCLDQVFPHLNIRLPPGTLLWGQPINEYECKDKMRKRAFMIFDVATVYGQDCVDQSYEERLGLAQRMADIVNYPESSASYVRVPPRIDVHDLSTKIECLPILPCKDAPEDVRMYMFSDGRAFRPHFLLLVENTAFFVGQESSTKDRNHSFMRTQFIKVPWKSNASRDEWDAVRFMKEVDSACRFTGDGQ